LLLIPVVGRGQSAAEILREKLRWTPEQIARALKSPRPTAPIFSAKPSAEESREEVVSDDPVSESEVHAAINPTDTANIIVSPIRQGESILDGLLCPVYYTKDFGKSWKKSLFKTLPKGVDAVNVGGGDPVLAFDADGKGYLTWISVFIKDLSFDSLNFGLYWASTTDGGETWSQSDSDAIALSTFSNSVPSDADIYDKQWVAVDRTTSTHRNTLYIAFLQASQSSDNARIVVRRKLPGSSHFDQNSVRISDEGFTFVQFSGIDVDPSGGVHVTFFGARSDNVYGLWHAFSSDGGATFSAPRRISDIHLMRYSTDELSETIPGITLQRFYPCPQFCIDKSNGPTRGNLYAVWTADGITSNRGDGLDIYLSRSTDNGATWSPASVVNDDPRGRVRHQHYPSIAVNDGGVVTVTWYDRRDDEEALMTNYYMAHSFDGGATFDSSFSLTTQPTDFSSVGEQNGSFGVGEYTQVLSTRGHAIAIWSDGRTNDGNLNIYAGFVPIVRSHSGVEMVAGVSENYRLLEPEGGSIAFELGKPTRVSLQLVDALGRVVATLAGGAYEPGTHAVPLDTRGLASGWYYCRLRTGFGDATRAIVITK
jgi:hypothetical protein